jgi:hypothetical protein
VKTSSLDRLPSLGLVLVAAALTGCGASTAVPLPDGGAKGGHPGAGQVGTADGAAGADASGQAGSGQGGAGQGGAGQGGAGQGGVGPDGGAGSTGGTGVKMCGDRSSAVYDQSAYYGAFNSLSYDGPAIVERSPSSDTWNELVLALPPAAADGGAGALPLHVRISGLPTKATFPLGARVWLTKSAPPTFGFGPAKPWSYTVRDKQDGRLLFAGGWNVAPTLFAPLTFDHETPTCTDTAYDDGCGMGTATYSSVDVHGDTTATIDDGQSATVRAGGVDYTVEIMSRNIYVMPTNRCGDYFGPYTGFAANAAVKDTTPLAGTFDVGAPIACGLENADQKQVGFSLYEIDSGTPYDGKVVYAKKRVQPGGLDCFDFTTTLTGADGAPALMEFCVSPGLFPEPAVGQALWATTKGYQLATLKSSQGGPLLLATVDQSVPFDATTKADLAAILGVPVDARQRCPYAAGFTLWETTFGTTSPVVLGPSGHATPTIGSKTYDAWMEQSDTTLTFSLVAR